MDAKDLRTDSTLSERNNDGKYGPNGTSIQCTKPKSYQDIGSSSSSKLDSPVARPCAVIGPDRIIPPSTTDAYVKKASVEPWPFLNNGYRRPPEYPSKIAEYQNQTRNISPRQTYQENMQRIMVPPTYSSVKVNEDFSQISDRSGSLPSKHSIKLNVVPDNKYCEVPYTINNTPNDQKSVRNTETCVSNVNPQYPQPAPQGWTPGCFSVRAQRGHGASELYQYPEYSNCAGSRHLPISRPHRTAQEEPGYVYPDPYYQDASIRYKPYPNVKDRYTQSRYEFIGNYSSPFYPAPVPPHKYDIHKSMSTHPYPAYTPLKGLESRMSEPIMEGYHRAIPPANYNLPYRNPVIHPPYGSIIANCPQGKLPSYLAESAPKMPVSNKPPYDANSNVYVEYENSRLKGYPVSENVFTNEMRLHSINNQMVMPNYPSIHTIPPHLYYKKDSLPIKNCEYANSMRNMDPLLNVMNPITHRLPHFSPGGIPISPTNSNASNDTTHTHSTLHEDCGYVSQTSGASIKSIDSAIYRNNEYYRRYYDPRYRPILRTSPMMPKQEYQSSNLGSKDKKQINVRQFLEMWNEGDDENDKNNTSKEAMVHSIPDSHHLSRSHDSRNNHEQLYVLGLVNVSSEDLSKYEHIQTVSKLPENIKGYNSIELLNQFEEVIESSNMNYYKANTSKENTMAVKPNFARQTPTMSSRSLSPLDVEAKISQSVIHKEVGCNFEIRPCSPKMLNVELATPAQNVLNERAIVKVTNPLSSLVNTKSPIMKLDENMDTSNTIKNQTNLVIGEHIKTPSCKLANARYPDSLEPLKTNYSLQDLESNSGVCLASLPRLDNDIELNFPEVNQQFINANKSETRNMQSIVNDPPQFIITGRNQVKDKKDTEYKLPNYIDEYEKQYPKLSKYRKNKGNGLEVNDEGFLPTVIRTDSVIIKNPENIKNLEESAEHFPVVKLLDKSQFSPMNLTSQCDKVEMTQSDTIQVYPGTADKKGSHNNEDKNSSGDLAIDFSFHKNNTNYSQMDKESADNIPAENNVTSPINNSEENVLPTNKKQDTCLSPEFCEEEEPSSPSTLNNESIKPLIVEDTELPTSNSLNTTEDVNCHISEEKRAEAIQPLDVKVATKNQEISLTKCDTTKIDNEFSIPDSFLTTNEKFDHKAHVQMSDVFYSEPEDFLKLKKMNNEFNGEEDVKIEDNNSTNEIYLHKKCVDTKENADTNETHKDSEMFLPELDTSEKVFISDLPEFSKQNYAEQSYIDESVSQPAIPEISVTMIFQHESVLELGEGKIEDDNGHCDDIIINDNERDVAVDFEKGEISNLLVTDAEKDSVNNTNANEDVIQHRQSGMTYTMDIEQKSASKLKEISVEGADIQCDGITTTNPVISGTVKSIPDRVFEPQQIQKERQSYQLIAKKVSLGQFEVPVDSSILKLNQEIKSDQKEKIMEGHILVKNKHHNEIDVAEVSNVVNLEKVVTGLKKNINNNDNKCSEDDTKWHKNEKFLIEQKHCVENTENCNEKAISLSCSGNEDNNIEHTISLTEIEKCPMNIKENAVHGDINYLSNIIEFTELNKPFSENGVLNKEVVSISENVLKDATESIENTGQTTCHLDNPLDDLQQAHNKDVLLSESDLSANVIFQSNGIINECIFKSDIKYEENIQQLIDQSDISSAFKSLKNDDSTNFLNSVDILQPVMSDGDSLHSCTPKLTVVNKNNTPIECNYNFTREICFRKNLFSPYVQKLLTFSEGRYNNCNTFLKSSYFDDGHEKGAVVLGCGNSSFKAKNIETEDESHDNCNEKNSSNTNVPESSRLVDYDSSDYSLSPCAGSDFKLYSKSEQNIDCIEKLQESLEIENEEVEKNQTTPTIGGTDVGDLSINLNESKDINPISEKITLETEHEIISNKEFKDDDNDDKEIIDVKYTNILELVEAQDLNEEEKCAEKNIGDGIICQLDEVSRHSLKRSLSDSALYSFSEDFKDKSTNNIPNTWPFKRKKFNDNLMKSNVVVENYSNVININRRYSISSAYTEENVSFCILIDNDCVIAEEDSDSKMCYTGIPENLISDSPNSSVLNTDSVMEIIPEEVQDNNICEYTESYVMGCDQDRSTESPWVEDVACVETIGNEDIAENIIISASSPDCTSDYEEPETICLHANEHTDIVKHIYGDKLCQNDAELVETLYNTPQMDVNKTLIHRESQGSEHCDRYYDRESLEKVLSETNSQEGSPFSLSYNNEMVFCSVSPHNTGYFPSPQSFQGYESPIDNNERKKDEEIVTKLKTIDHKTQDDTVHSCESSIDNVFSYSHYKESNDRLTSSSPEVSSTTSEEKSSSILLKITNFKGSIVSQISEYSSKKIDKKNCSKVTNDEFNSNNNLHSKKPLITKAAQKYIPPLKETIRDLKVKISLPQDSLKKFKQLKISKEELKQVPHNSSTPNISKKPKPKFEDVLKSIDEIQFKMHKEKSKKPKKSIPKVVIKKNLNGSHYASTKNKEAFNPDLTGRKWQPWVFIEKNSFIDNMAIRKKTKAIFSHRKNTFVLAEKFYKYKSVNSAKFFITQPTYSKPSSGQLKYTIKLKHSY